MKRILKLAWLGSTALIALASPADAAPALGAFVATLAGGALTGALAGGIVWATVLSQAAVAGVLAGAQTLLTEKPGSNVSSAQDLTLNRITPVTNGLIVYGERTLGGSIIARSTTPFGGKPDGWYHSIIPLACHEIDGAVAIYVGETLVWTEAQYLADAAAAVGNVYYWGQISSPFYRKIGLRVYNGSPDQSADGSYVIAASEWTGAARGRGVAYVYFNAILDRNLFPQGPLQIRVRLRGKKVFDPRTSTTAYSENPALHARDYALTPELFGGVGWDGSDVNDASIIALANVSDEIVGSEARFAYNGVLDTSISPKENFDRLSTAWGGWWAVDRGQLFVGGGSYEPPVMVINEDMMRGPLQAKARRPFEQQFNIVKAVYADPAAQHVPTDLPILSSETFKAQDNGRDRVRDLGELPGEVSFARGQGLTKLALLKGRRQLFVDAPCSFEAWPVSLGDTVALDVPRRGWNEKPFEVVGRNAIISPNEFRVGLSLIETGPDVFDRDTSEEIAKPAGSVSSYPSPTELPVVFPPSSQEEVYETRGGGGVKARVVLASQSESPFVEIWQFSHKILDGNTVLGPLTESPEYAFDDIEPGSYVFGARAKTRRGILSEWVFSNPKQILGLNDAPVAISGLSVQSAGGAVAMIRWNRHPSLDVQQGGRIEFRHSSSLAGATWQSSTSIGKSVAGGQTEAALPLKAGTYLARPFDALDIPGPVTAQTTKAASLAALSVVGSLIEAPNFTGQKADCSVSDVRLVMNANALSSEYEFSGLIDLGSVASVRLVTELEVLIGRRDSLFWDRGGTKFWQRGGDLFWESSSAFGDVDILVSETDDDPAAAPVWSDYQSLDAADFSARAFRFKAALSVENADFNVAVSTLSITAKQGV